MIVLDTSVLSHAFRRPKKGVAQHACVHVLEQLIADDAEFGIPGIVFQELLSGVKSEKQAEALEAELAGFPLLLATRATHREAAKLVNKCRAKGIATATADALISATTMEAGGQLFTTDDDFRGIADQTGLELLGL